MATIDKELQRCPGCQSERLAAGLTWLRHSEMARVIEASPPYAAYVEWTDAGRSTAAALVTP